MAKLNARLLGRPIPLIVLAAAVLIGTFSGVAYAASQRSSPGVAARTHAQSAPTTERSSSTLVFHPLKLLNGAQSRSDYGTGNPQYAVSAQGVVYLAGSLSGPKNQNLAAFVMPPGARPGYYDCFSIYSNSSQNVQVVGALHIYASGKAYVQGPDTNFFSSLSGISYVAGY